MARTMKPKEKASFKRKWGVKVFKTKWVGGGLFWVEQMDTDIVIENAETGKSIQVNKKSIAVASRTYRNLNSQKAVRAFAARHRRTVG
jgi:hypothetical protein